MAAVVVEAVSARRDTPGRAVLFSTGVTELSVEVMGAVMVGAANARWDTLERRV
jgi:hypothetical protein